MSWSDVAATLVGLLPVVLGGVLTLAGVIIGPMILHRYQSKDEKAKRRAEKFEELVSAIYDHEHWLDEMRNHRVLGEDRPSSATPLAKIKAISTAYFPDLDAEISNLETGARTYEIWMLGAGQRRLGGEEIAEIVKTHEGKASDYIKAKNELLTRMLRYAEEKFD